MRAIASLLIVAATLSAQGPDVIPASALQADAALLRRAFEQLHPGLYRYNTPAQIDAAFRSLDASLRSGRTLAQAYLDFSEFTAKLQCGHTYPNFFNQPKRIAAALFEAPRVPFYFRWLGNRMIVTRSFASAPQLHPGTEILALNGVPVERILSRLLTIARADGGNLGKRVAYLEVQGSARYEAFDIYWPLYFPSSSAAISLRLKSSPSSPPETLGVLPATFQQRVAAVEPSLPSAKDTPLWEFRFLQPSIGYLRMPTWAMYNSTWNWQAFLDQVFASLAAHNAADLIVDLRGNEGGNDVGDVIVSHLVRQSVPRQAVRRMVRYRKAPADLIPFLDTWDPSFRDWGAAATGAGDGFFALRRDADDDPAALIQPATPRFDGRLWVIVGAANSSATFEFAQTVRQNRLGLLVGQTTGGNQRGINGGAFFFLRLPRSGIEIDLPLIAQFPDGPRPNAGLNPDVAVQPAVEAISLSTDQELAAILARIGTRRPPLAR